MVVESLTHSILNSPLQPVLSNLLSVGEAEPPQVHGDGVSPTGPRGSAGASPPCRCRIEVIDDAGGVVGGGGGGEHVRTSIDVSGLLEQRRRAGMFALVVHRSGVKRHRCGGR